MGGFGVLGFDNEGTAGSVLDFVKNSFVDVSLPATNNTGFSSTISNNPLSYKFANSCTPQYGAKTLWIKDLVAVEDRDKWIGGKPTAEIIWHEDFPAAKGFVYGSYLLQASDPAIFLNLPNPGDTIGVTGVIRRVEWILEPVENSTTATAQLKLDGANTTTFDYSGGAPGPADAGKWFTNKFASYRSSSTNETRNIHTYEVTPTVSSNPMRVSGVVVYFENAGVDNIDCFGGTTYVDKSRVSPVSATLAIPSLGNLRGGKSSIYVDQTAAFGLTSTLIPDILSVATGSSGTNLVTVSSGTGGSYPIGTLVFVPGTSHYIGNVLNQSSDTLTMGVTLPFGISNSINHLLQAGPSMTIGSSLFTEDWVFDFTKDKITGMSFPDFGSSNLGAAGLYSSGVAPFPIYQDAKKRFRILASSNQSNGANLTPIDANPPLFASYGLLNFSGFVNIEGNFQALDLEAYCGSGTFLKATFIINGIPMFNMAESFTNNTTIKRQIMVNAGPGFNSVKINTGSSNAVLFTKFTGYKQKEVNGPTIGLLSQLTTSQTFMIRDATNATLTAMGNIQRVYAEQFNIKGAWGIGFTESIAGGIVALGSDTTHSGKLDFYGSKFAFGGTVGSSFTLSVDGLPVTPTFNQWLGATLAEDFHTLSWQCQTGFTTKIECIDFFSSKPILENKQLFPKPTNIPDNETIEVKNNKIKVKSNSIGPNSLSLVNKSIIRIVQTAPGNTSMFLSGTSLGLMCSGTRPVMLFPSYQENINTLFSSAQQIFGWVGVTNSIDLYAIRDRKYVVAHNRVNAPIVTVGSTFSSYFSPMEFSYGIDLPPAGPHFYELYSNIAGASVTFSTAFQWAAMEL